MSQHVSDDLPRLLSGDATHDETLAAAGHLRSCPDCQHELVSAVIAHASLSSARRFAPEIVAPRTPDSGDEQAPPLPDLSDVFAAARHEAATATHARQRRRVVLGVAAAAVLASGIGIGAAQLQGSDSHQSGSRTLALAPFGVGTHAARATVADAGTMRIDATSLPKLDARHFYEVWLTDPARTRLQAVGSLSTSNSAVLTVSPNVMARYSAIEVSVQRVNQTSYSGTSVLRGSYA